MDRPYKFAVLTYSTLDSHFAVEFATDGEFTLDFFRISTHQDLLGVPKLLAKGYEAVLIYGGLGITVLKELGHAVVLIAKTDMDIIKALQKAQKISSQIALPVHEQEGIDVHSMSNLLNIKVHPIPYSNLNNLEKGVKNAVNKGIKVFVGGDVTFSFSAQHNAHHVSMTPNRYSFLQAIKQAKALAKARRHERESKEQLVAILKLFQEGVLCVDRHGKNVFYNDKIINLLRMGKKRTSPNFEEYFQHLMISDVLHDGQPRVDNILTVNGIPCAVTTLPISVQRFGKGAVTFIRDLDSIQTITGKLRERCAEYGFIAQHTLDDFIGNTEEIIRLKKMVQLYAPHDASVFIHGETGTGKEIIAQSLHNASDRQEHPFVVMNCAALPESLLESELFGYEEGAFTGAKKGGKPGVFELAHKGTIFLDEIGDMGSKAQMRLLRVLETKEVTRIGGSRVIPVDIRIISASHKDLTQLVEEGVFRHDLYYRLAGLRLYIPALRERYADFPLLVNSSIAKLTKSSKILTPTMLSAMQQYTWPGNMRELLAFMESYLILLGKKPVDESLFMSLLQDLYKGKKQHSAMPVYTESTTDAMVELKKYQGHSRKKRALEVLEECNGSKKQAAAKLGISYNTLWRILRSA